MSKNKSWLTSIILITFDVLAIYAIFRIATVFRSVLSLLLQRSTFYWNESLPLARLGFVFFVFIVVTFYLQGLYPGYGLTAVKELEQMGKSIFLAFFFLASISYLNKPFQDFPRSILLISWMLATLSLPIIHFILRNFMSRASWYGYPIAVFGEDVWRTTVAFSLKRIRRLGWKPQEVLPLSDIQKFSKQKKNIKIAVLASVGDEPVAEYVRLLNQRFRKVVLIRQTDNFGSLWVQPRDLDGYLGLEFHYHLLARRNRWLKRLIDILGAVFLLFVLSPWLLLLSILIRIDSPGPIFFRQVRLGRNFHRFNVLKFRTMILGAEEKLEELLKDDTQARLQYETFHKLDNDPRVTRIGRFLRKFSLDELPQLWNVLIGEMSLSGPRAYMPVELDKMGSYAPIILRVAPGMTGWWQVLGRHNTTFEKRLQLDEYYISNWSIWMDIYILMKTLGVVLRGTGV